MDRGKKTQSSEVSRSASFFPYTLQLQDEEA